MWHNRAGTQLVEPGDTSFWKGLWKTDAFRALLDDPRTGYAKVLEKAAQRPWWFVHPEQSYELRHFSIWFGSAFLHRTYENPVITDLYYWHDLVHGLTFRNFNTLPSEDQWRRAMRANEVAVSMETEVLIYMRAPELRSKSFLDRIWIDDMGSPLTSSLSERLATYRQELIETPDRGEYERALFGDRHPNWPLLAPQGLAERGMTEVDLWDLRRAVTARPNVDNPVEAALYLYEQQATPFYDRWANTWKEVETQRAIFEGLVDQGNWQEAVRGREETWKRVSDANGVPYGALAPLNPPPQYA